MVRLSLAFVLIGSLGCIVVQSGDEDEDFHSSGRHEEPHPFDRDWDEAERDWDEDVNNVNNAEEGNNFTSEPEEPEPPTPPEEPVEPEEPVAPEEPVEPDPPETQPSEPVPTNGDVSGMVIGEGMPEGAPVVAVWQVREASPPYFVKFGAGEVSGAGFTLDFSSAPPVEVLNDGKLGVAFLLALEPGASLPADGVLDRDGFRMLEGATIGVTRTYGVVWQEGGGDAFVPWAASFPEKSYSCGVANSLNTGFLPLPCDELELELTSSLDWVDWY